jgi:hypothetical protein
LAAVVVDVVIKIFKNNIDRIRQHCNLPKPVKRAINVTINTAALERQALFVVAMAFVKHPRFRLSNFILFPYPSKVLRRSLPFLTSHFFLSRPFFFFFPSLSGPLGLVISRYTYQRLFGMVHEIRTCY